MATAAAEAKVENVKQATEAASTVPFHAEVPEATEDFLHNHTAAGTSLAHLDPMTLYNLAEQGHLPFPEMIEATANALANGGRVSVPMSSYIARVAGQPFEDALHQTTRFGEGPSLEEANSGVSSFAQAEARPGINTGRLMSLLGANMYGDRSTQGATTLKELVQNSADAVRQVSGGEGGTIAVNLDRDGRTIDIHDNGAGMTPQILSGPFLQVAGSLKEGDLPGGSFGMAKMLTLYGSDGIWVRTLRDGTYSEMVASGQDLNRAIEQGTTIPFTTKTVTEMTPEERALFPSGHGTKLQIKLPAKYTDTNTGKERDIEMPSSYYPPQEVTRSPLFAPIHFTYGGDKVAIGSNFPAHEYVPFATVNFAWGEGRVYVKPTPGNKWQNNLHFLSNGLFQFSQALKKGDDLLPIDVYIDLRPTFKPEEGGYPFSFNRQQLTPSAKEEVDKVTDYLRAAFAYEALAGSAKGFGSIQELSPGGAGASTSLEPAIRARPPPGSSLPPLVNRWRCEGWGALSSTANPHRRWTLTNSRFPENGGVKAPAGHYRLEQTLHPRQRDHA